MTLITIANAPAQKLACLDALRFTEELMTCPLFDHSPVTNKDRISF